MINNNYKEIYKVLNKIFKIFRLSNKNFNSKLNNYSRSKLKFKIINNLYPMIWKHKTKKNITKLMSLIKIEIQLKTIKIKKMNVIKR